MSRRNVLNPDELLDVTRVIREVLPKEWGFYCVRVDGVEEPQMLFTRPPEPLGGSFIWIARELIGGTVLKGAIHVPDVITPDELRLRALAVVSVLEIKARQHAARFN